MELTRFLDENYALICERYRGEARQANSKPALASLLDVNVCEWLCMMQPRHDSVCWLTENFPNYINGRWAKDCGGYTCSVYAGYEGEITLVDTVTAVIGCDARLVVPDNAFVRVFASGGTLRVARFGKDAHLVVEATGGTDVVYDEWMEVETKKLDIL